MITLSMTFSAIGIILAAIVIGVNLKLNKKIKTFGKRIDNPAFKRLWIKKDTENGGFVIEETKLIEGKEETSRKTSFFPEKDLFR